MKVKVGDVVSLTGDRYGTVISIDITGTQLIIDPIYHPEDEGIMERPYFSTIESVESIR